MNVSNFVYFCFVYLYVYVRILLNIDWHQFSQWREGVII